MKNSNKYLTLLLSTIACITLGTSVCCAEEVVNMTVSEEIPYIYADGEIIDVQEGNYTFAVYDDMTYVMNINGNSAENGANIDIMPSADLECQKFTVSKNEDGTYKIISVHSGKSLDVENGSNAPEANLQQAEYTGADNQKWIFRYAGESCVYIESALGTYIDNYGGAVVDGNNVWMYEANQSSTQKWMLLPVSVVENVPDVAVSAEESTPNVSVQELEVEQSAEITASYCYMISNASDPAAMINVKDASIENGANIELLRQNNMDQQIFYLDPKEDGYYQIRSAVSGKVLTVEADNPNKEANLIQSDANGMDGQLWKFIEDVDGFYKIKSKLGTYIDCYGGLTEDSTKVWLYDDNDSFSQKWKMTPITRMSDLAEGDMVLIPDGVYTIASASDYTAVVQVDGGAFEDGANVNIWVDEKAEHQKIRVTSVGNGYYIFTMMHSGMALDVEGTSSNPEVNLQQLAVNGGDGQKWHLIYAGDNHCYIQSALGTFMDLAGGNTENGNNIWLYNMNGSHSQKWDFFLVTE